MTNVRISMNTRQYDKFGNEDIIEVVSTGSMYEKNESIHVVYKEELEKGKTYVTTTIKVSNNEILIKRFGVVNSTMRFVLGTETFTKYKTPQGLFDIKINTTKLDIKNSSESINIDINYNMEIVGLFEGLNKVCIEIKK
jgi:uncharacterized beta-barrel protein YwiB (DUF1934 family)